MNLHYSITAYQVDLKKREKGINGQKLEDLTDYSYLLYKPFTVVEKFIANVKNTDYSNSNLYFLITQRVNNTFNGYDEVLLQLRYGSANGVDFSVFRGNVESQYDKDAKIVKEYVLFFYYKDEKLYCIAFRNGTNSCKTVIEKEFKKMLENTNMMISLNPISNEEYIQNKFGNAGINSIQYETIYKIDDGDDANPNKKGKIRYSTVNIDMTNEKNKAKFIVKKFIDFLKGNAKETVINKASIIEENNKDVEIDKDSFKIEIELNGTKRVVSFDSLTSLLYDVDITNELKVNHDGEIDMPSLINIVEEYMEGIFKNEL